MDDEYEGNVEVPVCLNSLIVLRKKPAQNNCYIFEDLKSLKKYLCFQATGEDFSVEPTESRRPFRALLDVGLIKTTTGNRVFGALKVS